MDALYEVQAERFFSPGLRSCGKRLGRRTDERSGLVETRQPDTGRSIVKFIFCNAGRLQLSSRTFRQR